MGHSTWTVDPVRRPGTTGAVWAANALPAGDLPRRFPTQTPQLRNRPTRDTNPQTNDRQVSDRNRPPLSTERPSPPRCAHPYEFLCTFRAPAAVTPVGDAGRRRRAVQQHPLFGKHTYESASARALEVHIIRVTRCSPRLVSTPAATLSPGPVRACAWSLPHTRRAADGRGIWRTPARSALL